MILFQYLGNVLNSGYYKLLYKDKKRKKVLFT